MALNNEQGERNQGSFYIIQRLHLYSLAEGTEGGVGCEPWGPKSRTLIPGVLACHVSTVFVPLVAIAQLLGRVRLFASPWTRACRAPLSKGFSQQGNWNGLLPRPSPGDLLDLGSNPHLCTGRWILYPWHHLESGHLFCLLILLLLRC